MSKFDKLHTNLINWQRWTCLERTEDHAYYMAGDCNVKIANGEVFKGGNGRIALTWIQSETRGHGTKALRELCGALDRVGLTCDLWAEAFNGQIPQNVLVGWYARHGFKPTDSFDECQDMTRLPGG